ncbi:MAG: undecaprenyldiphospho-muramoylpentapeptide beta-N-acetylglucosaminyltransferase [Gammaproteobacteria bacterium]|nr:undecaprenyldiphospho-muramoylpentapeptide beta-N-acetylglucosaminyltransferase [Gammaproteobacteria bacterium]NNF62476.1 undecaprenyldiphospho-muramoylpentapeptide beta-N-acetylglucosaminyltransferase [Gammaproteobacteria bacterium]NNM21828.1 undecaprenyldiphospho-muramoylpentapeptide beta-N-acetylglucosaminyltransferase [Gammaproteobacteria bacterium]
MTSVMIMAGGTGGHVYPALAVARRMAEQSCEVSWLGTRTGLEARVVPEAGIAIDWLKVSGLRGRGLMSWLLAPFVLVRAVWQAARAIRRRRPAVVLGMGGFVAGPGGIAAWLLRRPLVIHEQNAVAGLTNRLLAPFAKTVIEAFPGSFDERRGAQAVGNPVRREIVGMPTPRERFAVRSGRPNLLVLGGSQGALALNEIVPRAIALIESVDRPQVWHQCGARTHNVAEKAYAQYGIDVRLSEFIEDMPAAYGWADLVVCRAGALTIAELAAAGVGALLVPYPLSIDDHQTLNARYLEAAGAGMIVAQSELTPELLATALEKLLSDRQRLLDMAEAARRVAQPDATESVVQACLQVAGRARS